MKPWMLAALFGALFGLYSRRWLNIDVGHGQTFEHTIPNTTVTVTVICGFGNVINYNQLPPVSTLPSDKESSHAEGA